MDGKDLMYGAIAIGVLIVLSKLFGDDPQEREAEQFPSMAELFNGAAMSTAIAEGVVPLERFQGLSHNGGVQRVGQAVARLENSPGIVDDNEAQASGAITSLASYPELLLFSETFNVRVGKTPGTFILGFMDPTDNDDVPFMSSMVKHIKRLRAMYR